MPENYFCLCVYIYIEISKDDEEGEEIRILKKLLGAMHGNKKHSKADGTFTNNFRRKMAGEISARRCKKM